MKKAESSLFFQGKEKNAGRISGELSEKVRKRTHLGIKGENPEGLKDSSAPKQNGCDGVNVQASSKKKEVTRAFPFSKSEAEEPVSDEAGFKKKETAGKKSNALPDKEKSDDVVYKRTAKGLMSFTGEMRKILKPLIGKKGFASFDLISSWGDIAGEELALGVRPEKITYPRGQQANGTLHVKAADGSFALLMEYKKQAVISRVNRMFGYQAVSKVKITQGAVFSKPVLPPVKKEAVLKQDEEDYIRQVANQIEDEELRAGLLRLGRHILLKEKEKKENK